MSMRSKGGVDVSAVCGRLGGGGHRFAAGFTSGDDVAATVAAAARRARRRAAPAGVTGRARTGWSSSTSRPG